mmetsp:Transcript_94223/g.275571  ORF Transcript_94223/g.275571 Transcript_94223/m.275571 type:complete len:200 (-) Transcript_94223:302-901(-)
MVVLRLACLLTVLATSNVASPTTAPSGMSIDSLMKKANEAEDGVYEASKAYCDAHKMDPDGTVCCMTSSCFWDDSYPAQAYVSKIPDVSCNKDRGATKCWGGSLFPKPQAGICICKSGHCINGKCQNKSGGMIGDLESDLFAVTNIKRAGAAPSPVMPWLACSVLWLTLGVAAIMMVMVVHRSFRSVHGQDSHSEAFLE